MKEPIQLIAYYLKKTNEFLSAHHHERNSFRSERLIQYKDAMNERLKKSLGKRLKH